MNNIPIKNEVKSILAKKGLTMTHVVELINNNRKVHKVKIKNKIK